MKVARWFLPIILALLGIAFLVSPVLASIPLPTELDIEDVDVYENTRENGDQLYLITYDISFGNGTQPDENINELFFIRLLDEDDDNIATAIPYAYFNQGYDLGVAAFYFEAAEAPTWQGDYSVQMVGNPLGVNWTGGDAPSTTTNSINWNTGTMEDQLEFVSAKIAYLATELEQAWSVEMTTSSLGTTILSDTGQAYFLRVIPYLSEVAPYVLGDYTYTPDYPEVKPSENTYSDFLEDSISGTIFDLGGPARSLDISRGALTAALYYSFVVAFFILLHSKHKFNKGTMLLLWPFIIAGHFIGVPLIVTTLAGSLSVFSISIAIYKGHSS